MLKLFKKFTLTEWLLVLISIGFIVVQVWLDLTIPDFMKKITNLILAKSELSEVLKAGGLMLTCALGSLIASVIVSIFAARLASNFSANVRGILFRKVESFSMQEISSFSTSTLITRSTNDVTQVQSFIVMGLQVIIKAPIMAIWAITKISSKSWAWTFSTGVAVVVLLLVVTTCMLIAIPKFKKIQKLTDEVNRVTRENLNGLRVIRAYNAEEYQEGKFEVANVQLTNTQLFAGRVMSFIMPGISMIMNGLALAIYWIGAFLIDNSANVMEKGELFSDMVVFSSYAMQVVMSFMMLVIIFIMLPRASVSAKRINDVLDKDLTIKDGHITDSNSEYKGEIEFNNVSFKYPDAEEFVLHDVSFKINKGETVAFIGSTGSGKSTVINLIPRFYDVTEGSITVDGIDIRDYSQKALRNKIGYVSQKAVLFTGTIKSNVAFGDNGKDAILDSDIVDAVYTAQAAEFVEKLENGYDGHVSQGGTNLSGGQKQRVSIARAIARQPEIFIFDDSFSALDYKTDRNLRDALKKECANATKLIVAQRIGTIRDADRIIVLDEGRVVGNGNHKELMNNCEVYRQIAYSQLSVEELL